jgi:hypothetical protein
LWQIVIVTCGEHKKGNPQENTTGESSLEKVVESLDFSKSDFLVEEVGYGRSMPKLLPSSTSEPTPALAG